MSKTEGAAAVQKTARLNVGSLNLASVRPLLGPWTIEGEDSERYEKLLKEVGVAAQPIDFIDWLLVKDFVDLTWEIQRGRRKREELMRTERTRIAEDISRMRRISGLPAEAGPSLADLDLQSLSKMSRELDRLDEHDEQLARRRDEILRQIERRRSGLGEAGAERERDRSQGWSRRLERDRQSVGHVGRGQSERINGCQRPTSKGQPRQLGAKHWTSDLGGQSCDAAQCPCVMDWRRRTRSLARKGGLSCWPWRAGLPMPSSA
jgi:hypothetical protein